MSNDGYVQSDKLINANESTESKTDNTENENKHNVKTKKRKIKPISEKSELPTEKVIQRATDIIEMLKD